jgi:hypothetical protein
MARADLEVAFKLILDTTYRKISGLGFRRRPRGFRKAGDRCAAVIDFQRSVESSQDRIRFTVNIGVVHEELLHSYESSFKNANCISAKFNLRLNSLLPNEMPDWWDVTQFTLPEAMAEEVSEAVLRVGVPYILPYMDREVLKALWETGQSPGLTDGQRQRYLDVLLGKLELQTRSVFSDGVDPR